MRTSLRQGCAIACVTLVLPALLAGQASLPEVPGSIVAPTRVTDAPLIAEVSVSVPWVQSESRATVEGRMRYMRDRHGRVRVDQLVVAPGEAAAAGAFRTILQPDADKTTTLLVDHTKRVVTHISPGLAAMLVGGDSHYSVAIDQRRTLDARGVSDTAAFHGLSGDAFREEELGSRQFAGTEAVGLRRSVQLPPGMERNNSSIAIVEERWDSKDLRITLYARINDPRFGVAEYRVVSLARTEPPETQFSIPDGYSTASISRAYPLIWESWRNPPACSTPFSGFRPCGSAPGRGTGPFN